MFLCSTIHAGQGYPRVTGCHQRGIETGWITTCILDSVKGSSSVMVVLVPQVRYGAHNESCHLQNFKSCNAHTEREHILIPQQDMSGIKLLKVDGSSKRP